MPCHFTLLSFELPSLGFFFLDPAATELYTLSLHDALPILVDRETFILIPVLRRSPGVSSKVRSSSGIGSERGTMSAPCVPLRPCLMRWPQSRKSRNRISARSRSKSSMVCLARSEEHTSELQ